MSDLIKTLHKKGDSSTNIYPNIKRDNIPSHAINNDKLDAYAVGTNNINDLAVTTSKLMAECVTTPKIGDSAVTTPKIGDGAVTTYKLSSELYQLMMSYSFTYLIYLGDNNDNFFGFFATTTLSSDINNFTDTERRSAIDFDKPNTSDYSITDLAILKIIIDGINSLTYDAESQYSHIELRHDNFYIQLGKDSLSRYHIILVDNGTTKYELIFDENLNIITLYHDGYIYMQILKLVNSQISFN